MSNNPCSGFLHVGATICTVQNVSLLSYSWSSVTTNFLLGSLHVYYQARGTIIRKINKTIEKRRQQHAQNSGDGFLGRLLEEENLPEEAVADFIINLLFAGNETTAKTMLFAIYFLTHCPLALKELLEEQERLRSKSSGSDFMLTWEDYKSLPFTQCVC